MTKTPRSCLVLLGSAKGAESTKVALVGEAHVAQELRANLRKGEGSVIRFKTEACVRVEG